MQSGKQFAIRINCCEHWIPWATPKWLKDKGCKGVQFTVRRGPDPNGACWEPDYLDPIYLEHLERLIKNLAARYDGDRTLRLSTSALSDSGAKATRAQAANCPATCK